MLILLLTGAGSLLLGALMGHTVGFYRGRQDKLHELHELQEEGWLSIAYNQEIDQSNQGHRGIRPGPDASAISDLLYEDPTDVGVRTPYRPRRDSEERRDDWAKAIRDTREAEYDEHTQGETDSD